MITTLRFNHSHRTVTLRQYDKKTSKLLAKFRSVPLAKDDFAEIYCSEKVNDYFFDYFYKVY